MLTYVAWVLIVTADWFGMPHAYVIDNISTKEECLAAAKLVQASAAMKAVALTHTHVSCIGVTKVK